MGIEMMQWMMRGQQETYPASIAHDGRTDFQQTHPNRGGAGTFQLSAVQGRLTQAMHERIGQCGQQQPKLVGRKLMDCLNRLGYDIEIRMRETANPVGHLVLTHT